MIIKYFGTSYEKGLTLEVKVFSPSGTQYGLAHTMTETAVDSAIYKTEDIIDVDNPLPKGVYVARIEDTVNGIFLGHNTFVWDGNKELTLQEINDKLWTETEKMQIRDFGGIDGDKMVARGGQLQKKAESDNDIVDTNLIN